MKNDEKVEQDCNPEPINKHIAREDLIEQLESFVYHFHKLPNHVQFSFVTYSDLINYLLPVLNLFKLERDGKV